MKRPRQVDNLAIGLFVLAVLYTIMNGSAHTILVGIGFTLIVLGALPRQVALAFLVGASAIASKTASTLISLAATFEKLFTARLA